MNNWKETTLGEIIKLNYGKGLVGVNRDNGNVPVYGSSGITGYHSVSLVNEESLIIGRKGTVGSIYKSKIPFFPIDTTYYIRKSETKCDWNFLYYLLKFVKLERLNFDAVVPGLNREVAYAESIYIPGDIEEQKEIAAVLSSLDGKIELLRRQNETLEKIAQTIFKEWFVDFTIDGKKLKLENGIPKGWRVGKLGEVVELFDSKRVPLASNVRAKRKGKYPYYGATSIMDYIDDYLFNGTYLLLAEDGSVMDEKGCPVLQYVWGQFWVSNHSHVMQGKNGFSTEILYVLLRKTSVAGIVNGAVQLKINQSNLVNFEILVPTKEILEKFDSVLQSIFDKSKNIQHQIQTLSSLRDTMLPKLMSGEVKLKSKIL